MSETTPESGEQTAQADGEEEVEEPASTPLETPVFAKIELSQDAEDLEKRLNEGRSDSSDD